MTAAKRTLAKGSGTRVAETSAAFSETFGALRGMLAKVGRSLEVTADTPTDFQLASKSMRDRQGRPLFVAAVQIKKNYVSYHLMPIYAVPGLIDTLSPALRKRMQGKACFNFTTVGAAELRELEAVTSSGFSQFKNIRLPWAHDPRR